MAAAFFEQPILNSPYSAPTRHHALDPKTGQPLNLPPVNGRRKSELISPVPAAKRQGRKAKQAELDLFAQEDEESQAYRHAPQINRVDRFLDYMGFISEALGADVQVPTAFGSFLDEASAEPVSKVRAIEFALFLHGDLLADREAR